MCSYILVLSEWNASNLIGRLPEAGTAKVVRGAGAENLAETRSDGLGNAWSRLARPSPQVLTESGWYAPFAIRFNKLCAKNPPPRSIVFFSPLLTEEGHIVRIWYGVDSCVVLDSLLLKLSEDKGLGVTTIFWVESY